MEKFESSALLLVKAQLSLNELSLSHRTWKWLNHLQTPVLTVILLLSGCASVVSSSKLPASSAASTTTSNNATANTISLNSSRHESPSQLTLLEQAINYVSEDVNITYAAHPSSRRRPRRDIFHLYNMMACTTGCDPLSYKGYGCYCGFLGSGVTVDGIDRCCMKHDYCYADARCSPQALIYFVPYKWKCNGGHPYCITGRGDPKPYDACAHHLCECDRQFAECIGRYPCPAHRATCSSNPLRSLG